MDRIQQLEEQVARLQRLVQDAFPQGIGDSRADAYRMAQLGTEHFRTSLADELKCYKNLVFNSSFEQKDENDAPLYWTGGLVTENAAWYGTHSLMLGPGLSSAQSVVISPAWYGSKKTWVAFVHKGGSVKCDVVTESGAVVFTYSAGYAADWPDGRVKVRFDPSGNFSLRFTNTDTQNAYIDAVQCEPDLSGKWPSLYSDGPHSAEGGTAATPTPSVSFYTAITPVAVSEVSLTITAVTPV